MRLSIVIPTKNEENYLPRLLESIRSQVFSDYEVIVADAASTDRTREVAVKFGAKVVEGGLPGPGRNRGAEAAQGDRLLFLDADVVLPSEDFLSDMLKASVSDTSINLFLKANAPIKVSYNVGPATLTYFLAPRIESD